MHTTCTDHQSEAVEGNQASADADSVRSFDLDMVETPYCQSQYCKEDASQVVVADLIVVVDEVVWLAFVVASKGSARWPLEMCLTEDQCCSEKSIC